MKASINGKFVLCLKRIVKIMSREILLSILGFVLVFNYMFSQDVPDSEPVLPDSYAVRWISQFPSLEKGDKKSFKEFVSGMVFGKKAEPVMKPFSVLARGPNSFLVLDQGSRTIIENQKGSGEILRPFRNRDQEFPSLVGMCAISNNELLFTDSRQNKIYHIAGDDLSDFNTSLILNQPTGIAYSEARGEIWVVETGAHSVSVFNMEGELLKRIGERGSAPGTFNFPTFIWIDASGIVYIVDSMNFRIQIFDAQGNFMSMFGEIGDATGFMARPKGIATDSKGNIYIADALFHAVQVFDKEGNLLYYFGKQGEGKGEFWMPAGIYIDDKDYIYVADSYNSRVQVFQLVNN